VAHPISVFSPRPNATAADGLASGAGETARVRPLRAGAELRRTLFVAGCDPAIGLLGEHLAELPQGPRVRWLPLGSGEALAAQAAGTVHIAGIHLAITDDDEANTAEVRRVLARRSMAVVNLASWEQGLVLAPRNPLGLRTIADLGARGVRVVEREPGAGAQRLLERGLAAARLRALTIVATARGHLEVAGTIACGAADAGVATREAADAFDLAFVPLETARFDLVIPEDLLAGPLGRPLMDILGTARFKRELRALAGYETRRTGDVVARVAA
jgi:molybdate-binding protein